MKPDLRKIFFATVTFVIACISLKAQVLPESFEGTFPPSGWYKKDSVGVVKTWTATSTAKTGTQAAYVQFENVPTGIAQNWLISPTVAITPTTNILSYWERESYATNWGSTYHILVSASSQTNLTTFTSVATYSENLVNPLVYNNRLINLSAFTGQTVYIAFELVNDDGDDWFLDDIDLVGGCVSSPTAGIITGTNNTTYGTTNSFTVSPVIAGNIQWLSAPSANGPWTAIPNATSTPQNITALTGGTLFLTAISVATVTGCLSDTTDIPLGVNVFFMGDNSCNSVSLTIGPSSAYYQFLGATVQTGEVKPPSGSCTGQLSWCVNNLNNTKWFSFTAPASGHVIIQAPDFDSRLAVWKAATCNGVLSATTATFVCANEDDPNYAAHGGVQYSSYLHSACLTPGSTYYIQADSFNPATASDSTRVIVTDGGTPLDVSFTGLNNLYCIPGAGNSILNPTSTGGIFTLNTSTTSITSFSPGVAGVGTHTLTYSVSGCKTTSITTVANSPSLIVTTNSAVICAGQSATLNAVGATTYSWSSGPIGPVIAVSPSVTTTYTLTGTTGSCSSSAVITESVSACIGIKEFITNPENINVYPNPNNGLFTITAEHIPDEINITNLLGQKVFEVKPTSTSTLIDLEKINQGIYVVIVKFKTKNSVIKVIKE